MPRRVEPEWLDELPAEDPRAIRSRKDLQRLNAFMRNAKLMAGALRAAFEDKPGRIVDLGAGDGRLMLEVARQLPPSWKGTHVTLLDRQPSLSPATRKGFEALGWQAESLKADVLDWLRQPAAQAPDAIVANLFLHHFREAQLAELLQQAAARTKVFIAVEPRRWAWSSAFPPLFWLIGCGPVTRHDALVSIRAGFVGRELSPLWPPDENWSLQEGPASLCSHLFVAKQSAS
jgi:hypothetical protein